MLLETSLLSTNPAMHHVFRSEHYVAMKRSSRTDWNPPKESGTGREHPRGSSRKNGHDRRNGIGRRRRSPKKYKPTTSTGIWQD
jgi:hypothetical protein